MPPAKGNKEQGACLHSGCSQAGLLPGFRWELLLCLSSGADSYWSTLLPSTTWSACQHPPVLPPSTGWFVSLDGAGPLLRAEKSLVVSTPQQVVVGVRFELCSNHN